MKKIILLTSIISLLFLVGASCVNFEIRETSEPNEAPSTLPGEAVNTPAPETETMTSPEESRGALIDETTGWLVFHDEPWAIEMKYPPRYKTVRDTYGWPHALVHFIEDEPGRQSYRARIETWENENDFRETYNEEPAFIIEHPNGKNWVTVHYNPEDSTYPGLADEWRLIISTFRFTIP